MNKKRRGAEAARKFTKAQQERQIGKELEQKGKHGPYDHGTFHYRQAERLEGEAKELLKPAGEIVRGGGEAMDLGVSDLNWNLVETLTTRRSEGRDKRPYQSTALSRHRRPMGSGEDVCSADAPVRLKHASISRLDHRWHGSGRSRGGAGAGCPAVLR